MTREQLLQAIRAYLIGVSGYDGSKVIVSWGQSPDGSVSAVRPVPPYLSVQVITDVALGRPQARVGVVDGTYVSQQVQGRACRVQVSGYGDVLDAMEAAQLEHNGPSSAALALCDAGVSVRSWSDVLDATTLRDTAGEPSYSMDLLCYIERAGTAVEVPFATSVIADLTLTRDDSGTAVADIDASVSSAPVYAVSGSATTAFLASGAEWSALALATDPAGPSFDNPRDIALHSGRLVMAAEVGTVAWSANGVDWTTVSNGGSLGDIYALRVLNGRAIGVGSSGTLIEATDVTSPWTANGSAFGTANMRALAVSDLLAVAAGAGGVVWTSPTGADGTWTQRALGAITNIDSAAYSPVLDLFVLGGSGGRTFRSSDGVTWFDNGATGSNDLYGMAWGDGRFLAGGGTFSGSGRLTTSTDGQSWADLGAAPTASRVTGVYRDDVRGLWVLGFNDGRIATSASHSGPWDVYNPASGQPVTGLLVAP